jgi:hypothetical protein
LDKHFFSKLEFPPQQIFMCLIHVRYCLKWNHGDNNSIHLLGLWWEINETFLKIVAMCLTENKKTLMELAITRMVPFTC